MIYQNTQAAGLEAMFSESAFQRVFAANDSQQRIDTRVCRRRAHRWQDGPHRRWPALYEERGGAMNRNVLIPRRTRRSKGKLSKLLLRIGHYRHYRKNGYSIKSAWFKSSLVIN